MHTELWTPFKTDRTVCNNPLQDPKVQEKPVKLCYQKILYNYLKYYNKISERGHGEDGYFIYVLCKVRGNCNHT